jgi:nitrate/nitrite transporter NarK
LWTRNTPPGVEWPGSSQERGTLRGIMADLRFWRIAPLAFFLTGTLLGFQGLWAGPYLYDVLGLGPIQAGNLLFLLSAGATTGFAASGWLSDRLGVARTVGATSILFLLCQLVLAFSPPLGGVGLAYCLFGFFGAFNIMLLAHGRRIFPPTMTGQVVTAVNLFGIGGTFLLQWWMGLIVGAFPTDAAGHYPPQAYMAALLFTAAGTLVSLIWYWPLAHSK